jgi:hypothetical protein
MKSVFTHTLVLILAAVATFIVLTEISDGPEHKMGAAPPPGNTAFHQPMQPPNPESGHSRPEMVDPPHEGSPYDPYPISFPKVLAGYLYFEKHMPDIGISRAQCSDCLPIVEKMDRVWAEIGALERKLHLNLTADQEKYISSRKHELEKTEMQNLVREKLSSVTGPGYQLDEFSGMATLARIRAKLKKEGDPIPAPARGKVLITAGDITAGLVLLEDDPVLRMNWRQAVKLSPIFEKLSVYMTVMNNYLAYLVKQISEEQLQAIVEHIEPITKEKFALFDERESIEQDPLFQAFFSLCRGKMNERSSENE